MKKLKTTIIICYLLTLMLIFDTDARYGYAISSLSLLAIVFLRVFRDTERAQERLKEDLIALEESEKNYHLNINPNPTQEHRTKHRLKSRC